MNQDKASCTDSGFSPQKSPVGSMVFEKTKSCFDELLFQLKYDDGNASDEDEMDTAARGDIKSLALPKLTSCLSLSLTVLMSQHSGKAQMNDNIPTSPDNNHSKVTNILNSRVSLYFIIVDMC